MNTNNKKVQEKYIKNRLKSSDSSIYRENIKLQKSTKTNKFQQKVPAAQTIDIAWLLSTPSVQIISTRSVQKINKKTEENYTQNRLMPSDSSIYSENKKLQKTTKTNKFQQEISSEKVEVTKKILEKRGKNMEKRRKKEKEFEGFRQGEKHITLLYQGVIQQKKHRNKKIKNTEVII